MEAERFTLEVGVPLAQEADGGGEVEAGTLPGGPVAMALHAGPYQELQETFAALERWIAAQGYRKGGSPWESYLTDPGEHSDPSGLRTAVFWPLAE
jgi:AraC family transcriptional regulator